MNKQVFSESLKKVLRKEALMVAGLTEEVSKMKIRFSPSQIVNVIEN